MMNTSASRFGSFWGSSLLTFIFGAILWTSSAFAGGTLGDPSLKDPNDKSGKKPPASATLPYYGEVFYQALNSGVANQELRGLLKGIMDRTHNPQNGGYDIISDSCTAKGCYQHTNIGYDRARVFLMGTFYLVQDDHGYGVKDVYCSRIAYTDEFGKNKPGPGRIPDDTVVNVEHTWPQSKFSTRYPKDQQKADLHHLFPTDSKINGIRGNNHFGEVTKDQQQLKCAGPRFGTSSGKQELVFEPPANHRGNVARALFYFAVKYNMYMDSTEESFLRKWANDDPVDDEERSRNDEIQKVQGSRNPFVDYPELVDRISSFQVAR